MFEIGNPSKLRHGHAVRSQQSAEYLCWGAIKQRCTYPKHKKYQYYGGRGIRICDHWKDSFENFFSDVGPRPSPQHSIDRFPDRNGNYEPGNVRWATRAQQMDNRDSTRMVTVDGETLSVAEICRRFNLNRKMVQRRLDTGWPVKKAIETPPLWRWVVIAGKRKRAAIAKATGAKA